MKKILFKTFLLPLLLLTSLHANEAWDNASPDANEYDWLQTSSGEWIKGEIKGMYDDKLEFDSDEFDLQSVDWEDIKQLKSHSLTSLNIEGQGTKVGRLHIKDGSITLITSTETLSLTPEQIISLTSGGEEEINYWSGKIAFGLTRSSGNTDKTEYTPKVNIKRQTADTRFKVDYLATYSKNNGEKTEDNQRLSSSIDIFQTRRFFWRPAFVEYYKDTFKNIKSKYTYGLGAGYDIYTGPRTNWTVFAGPAYQTTKFENVPDDKDETESTPAFILSSNYDIELTSNIDFIVKYQAYFVNKRSGTYVQHALATFETELINDFDLDVTFIWDRVQDPAENEDGTVPKRDDYKMVVSLGYSF